MKTKSRQTVSIISQWFNCQEICSTEDFRSLGRREQGGGMWWGDTAGVATVCPVHRPRSSLPAAAWKRAWRWTGQPVSGHGQVGNNSASKALHHAELCIHQWKDFLNTNNQLWKPAPYWTGQCSLPFSPPLSKLPEPLGWPEYETIPWAHVVKDWVPAWGTIWGEFWKL